MKLDKNKKITLGVFILIGLLIVTGVIYYMGSSRQLFGSRVTITAVFKNVEGLSEGNNVWFSGIKVGTVKQIQLVSDSLVMAKMAINNEASEFIKKDSYATIESQGLMGNKIIAITAGSTGAKSVSDGDELRTRNPIGVEAVIQEVKTVAERAAALAQSLNGITTSIQNGDGVLGTLIYDSTLSGRIEQSIQRLSLATRDMKQITGQANDVVGKINSGDGLAARLLSDEEWANDVGTTLDSLKRTSVQMSQAGRDLKVFMEKLNDEKGTIQQLLNDSTMANDLHETIINIKKGTEDLDEVVNTVNSSWLLNLFGGKDK